MDMMDWLYKNWRMNMLLLNLFVYAFAFQLQAPVLPYMVKELGGESATAHWAIIQTVFQLLQMVRLIESWCIFSIYPIFDSYLVTGWSHGCWPFNRHIRHTVDAAGVVRW